MDNNRALELVRTQLRELQSLTCAKDNPLFDKWHRDTRVVLQKIFGPKSRPAADFTNIYFRSRILGSDHLREQHLDAEAFSSGQSEAIAFLESVITELETFGNESAEGEGTLTDPLNTVMKLCRRFPAVARQLRDRHDGRPTLDVNDEYDVQDLLHALLRIEFDDIRPEEYTPSYAGKSARMDFLLKDHKIVIETKKTRQGLADKEVGDELIVDIERYKVHADCKTLICFVYDPEARIGNPAGLMSDLSGSREGLEVKVIIAPVDQ